VRTLHATAYEFGPYRLDPLARSLLRREELVALPPKAVEVLLELVKRPGTVVSKQELMQAVWPQTFVEESNLNQMIFLLRRALGNGSGWEYIATVPRRGYRFAADVHTVEVACRITSLAVLPLANFSDGPAPDYFADGITEAVITELAKIGSLRVVSRASVMRYKQSAEPVAQIARALRVQAVLQGWVSKSGDGLRITVRLVHAASQQPLWEYGYEAPLADILELERRLACDVAAALRAEVSHDEQARLAVSNRVHPQAYSLYLNGRYFARQLTEEGQLKAIRYFRESLEADPGFAATYAGLAECLIELAYFFGMEPRKAFAEAEPAAVKSVELDENLPEGHAVLSLLRLLNDWDWQAADAESRRAIELAPGDAYVYWKRGVYLRYAGRSEEAVAAHRRAESLDPFSLIAIEEVGWPLYYGRRYEEAADQFRRAVELEPNWDQLYFGLGLALAQLQRYEDAVAALRNACRLGPNNPFNHASLVYGLGRAGRAHEAKQLMAQLCANCAYVPRWFLAIVWVGLNELERALQALDEAFADREPCLVSLKVDPIFDPLRYDGRFAEMIRRVGLPA
jgi:DNA-binding winged helix-turn-helix (wHTH) protein/tetratricopeptide (TPR) repeat protein